MKLNDRICKMPPWTMGKIARELYDAMNAMGIGEMTRDKLHYQVMGGSLKDAAKFIDVRPYLG